MNPWLVYLFVKLDTLSMFFYITIIVTCMLGCVCIIVLPILLSEILDDKESRFVFLKWTKLSIVILAVSSVLYIAVPDTKQFAAIYLIPRITNNQELQKVPSDIVKLLRGKLNEWIDDAEEATKDKK